MRKVYARRAKGVQAFGMVVAIRRCQSHNAGPGSPLRVPSATADLGCRMVAERGRGGSRTRFRCKSMVGARGFEPRTSPLSEKRSNRLSYAPTGALESTRAAASVNRGSGEAPAGAPALTVRGREKRSALGSLPTRLHCM